MSAADPNLATGRRPPRRLLTIAHSYVVAMNRRLAEQMARAGGDEWEVTAVAPNYFHGSGDLRPVAFEERPTDLANYDVKAVPARGTNRVHFFRYGRSLRRLLRDHRWDIVHAWEEPYILAGHQIGRWTCDDSRLVYRTAQSWLKRYPPPFNWIEQYDMRRAAGWICSGTLVAQTLNRKPIYAQRPMQRIPLGVDVEVFKPDRSAGEATLRQLNWSTDGPPVIGYLGRFVTDKGLTLLMEALDQLSTPWRAMFVGAGPMEDELRRFADRHSALDRVRICNDVRHDDVPRYLNAMDMMCAPSQTKPNWREQFGRMLVEAFACGVAVIGSDSGEIPHVIGETGIICSERDPAAWSAAIGQLIDSPSRRAELAARGLERAHREFAWPVVGRMHLEFFNRLLDEPRRDGAAS